MKKADLKTPVLVGIRYTVRKLAMWSTSYQFVEALCAVEDRFHKLIGWSQAAVLPKAVQNSAVSGPQVIRLEKVETQPAIAWTVDDVTWLILAR